MDNLPLNQSIFVLNLSRRIANSLYRNGIKTLDQLLSTSVSHLKSMRGLGEKSISEINEALQGLDKNFSLKIAVSSNSSNASVNQENHDSESPITLQTVTEQKILNVLLANVDERAQSIILYRYGLDGESPHTLQELADRLGVTRERVRQICARAINSRIRHNATYSPLIKMLHKICEDYLADCLISTNEGVVHNLIDQMAIEDLDKFLSILVFLNDEVFKADSQFGLRLNKSLLCAKTLDTNFIWQLIIRIKNHIQDKMSSISIEELHNVMMSYFPDSKISRQLVEVLLNNYPDFAQDETGNWALEKWKKHFYDEIVLVLRELKRPAHFSEITQLLMARFENETKINPHSVHAQLGRYTNLFIRTDSGTFGLREQFPDAPIQPPKYIDLIEEVLEEAGIPLSIQTIFTRVNPIREAKYSSITIYLGTHGKFIGYGNGMYGLAKWGLGKTKVGDSYIFRYCPTPLLSDTNNPSNFFESIVIGYNSLIDNPDLSSSQFYRLMLEWAKKVNQQENNAQSIFDAWYVAGLIDYVDLNTDSDKKLILQIPENSNHNQIREHCLNQLCQRVHKMSELLSALDILHLPNITKLQNTIFGSQNDGFDVPIRLSLLKSFEALREDNGTWYLTRIGRDILAKNPPSELITLNQLNNIQADSEKHDTDDWDDTLDVLLI